LHELGSVGSLDHCFSLALGAGFRGTIAFPSSLRAFIGCFAEFIEVGDDRFYNQTLFPFSFGDFDYGCFECLDVTIGVEKLRF